MKKNQAFRPRTATKQSIYWTVTVLIIMCQTLSEAVSILIDYICSFLCGREIQWWDDILFNRLHCCALSCCLESSLGGFLFWGGAFFFPSKISPSNTPQLAAELTAISISANIHSHGAWCHFCCLHWNNRMKNHSLFSLCSLHSVGLVATKITHQVIKINHRHVSPVTATQGFTFYILYKYPLEQYYLIYA